jgi:hydroxymethylbilane synthase
VTAALRLGTRGSRLALWQAEHVKALIEGLPGAPRVDIVIITTTGDRIRDVPLSQVSGQAFFTKEIESAVAEGRVDLAVHSMKDLATSMPEGLVLAATPEREDPRDVLLSAVGAALEDLPAGARIGTSSLRRKAFIACRRPDLVLAELRGNVPTRVRKLHEGEYDAILLAAAGVKRLGLGAEISAHLEPERFTPAPAQGALALQARAGDLATTRWLEPLDHPPTRAATTAERALLRRVEGGCQVPVGALATVTGSTLELRAMVCSLDGTRCVEGRLGGDASRAEGIGLALAERLLGDGGEQILAAIRTA